MVTPAIYDARLLHVRTERQVRRFHQRLHIWLVDLDELPTLPWFLRPLAAFHARDHLGSADRTIRRNLEEWLAGKDIDATGDRILMLAVPRSFGYVFNPLTVFWCFDADNRPRCVVAEVQNTYAERHQYLFLPDASWSAETDKEFYVSPFLGGGRYRVRLAPPGEHLALAVTLYQDGRPTLRAVLTGRRYPASPARVLWSALRHPLLSYRIRASIQRQGITLWLRRFPIIPRGSGNGRS